MTRYVAPLLAVLSLAFVSVTQAATQFVEGKHYTRIQSPRPTSVPAGKVEVMEVFSYGCPACDRFVPVIKRIQSSLPPNAQMVFLPASFNPREAWPMFQRAYITAQMLGVADKNHEAVYQSVWQNGELAISDPTSHQIKTKLPTIEDAAKFYNKRSGVPVDKFISTAKSFAVDVKVKAADDLVRAYQVDSTPTLIVNGKWKLNNQSIESIDQIVELVKFLVAKESAPATS